MIPKVDIWMPFYIGDYLAGTGHLSTTQHGAYLLLLMHYWTTGKPLPNDDKKLANIAKLSFDDWLDIKPTISEFFIIGGDKWTNRRLERELKTALRNRKMLSKRALKASDARWAEHRKKMKEKAEGEAIDTEADAEMDALFD
jgi:uncharacterized protein YdaU (DUF1376 family)